ncbi:Glutamate receptor ionotropic, NMDA 3A [Manis javanica]|nr:Glutamate receptor ionotropic, NMDA 3A [Manis javanica]
MSPINSTFEQIIQVIEAPAPARQSGCEREREPEPGPRSSEAEGRRRRWTEAAAALGPPPCARPSGGSCINVENISCEVKHKNS